MGNVRSEALLNLLKISSYFEGQEDYDGVQYLLHQVIANTFPMKIAKLDELKDVFQQSLYSLDPINKKVISEFGMVALTAVRDFETFHAFLPAESNDQAHNANRELKWSESTAKIDEAYAQVKQIWDELSEGAQSAADNIYATAQRALSTEWTPSFDPESSPTFECDKIVLPK